MADTDLPDRLTTRRLELRRPRATDGAALADALSDALDVLAPWFRWAEALARWGTREDLALRAAVLERRNASGDERSWLVWDADRVVGEVTLRTAGLSFGVLEYQVWVLPRAWGRGYGTEGSAAALDAVRRARFAEWVAAECASANQRSRRLLCRLGFERFGSSRDHERYVRGCS